MIKTSNIALKIHIFFYKIRELLFLFLFYNVYKPNVYNWDGRKLSSSIIYSFLLSKELSLCNKLWIYNPYIFKSQCRTSLIFQTFIIWSSRIHSLKYLRSTTLESKDIGFRKQILWQRLNSLGNNPFCLIRKRNHLEFKIFWKALLLISITLFTFFDLFWF